MVDYTVTPANVKKTNTTVVESGIAGATIVAGQPLKVVSTKLEPAQGDALVNSDVVGIALNGAAVDQPVQYARSGGIEFGTTFAVGDAVVLSAAAAGGIAPYADLSAGNSVVSLGLARTTSILELSILNPKVSK